MAGNSDTTKNTDCSKAMEKEPARVKVICLGDSAVGKSKLVERFLMDGYKPQQLSTFALTLFKYATKVNEQDVNVEFWDTAGQERFIVCIHRITILHILVFLYSTVQENLHIKIYRLGTKNLESTGLIFPVF